MSTSAKPQKLVFHKKFAAASDREKVAADAVRIDSKGEYDITDTSNTYVMTLSWFQDAGSKDVFFWYKRSELDYPVLLVVANPEDDSMSYVQALRTDTKTFERLPRNGSYYFPDLALTIEGVRSVYRWGFEEGESKYVKLQIKQEMSIESHIATSIYPSRNIEKARPFELTAYNNIKCYIKETDDEILGRCVGAYWLADSNQQDSRYIAVIIAIESGPGRANYIALPQRLFGVDVDKYVFAGSFVTGNGIDAFATIGSTGDITNSGVSLSDIIIFYRGVLDKVLTFDNSNSNYKIAYQRAK